MMSTIPAPSIVNRPNDEKRKLLAVLVRDLMETEGSPLSVQDAAGDVVVYSVPHNARVSAERAMRAATPEDLALLQRRATDLTGSLSLDEAIHLPRAQSQEP